MTFAPYEPEAARGPAAEVTVRPVVEGDLDACAALIVTRTGEEPAVRRGRLEADLDRGDGLLLVAEVGTEIAGYAQVMKFVSPDGAAPDGYYLIALIVATPWRRRGIGELLTRARMEWVAARADEVWYFANAANGAILDLNAEFGFAEVTREFSLPGVTFGGGVGVLLRAPLR